MVSPSDSSMSPEVLSTVVLEAPAPSSHPRGIQRSQDGQFLVVTRSVISITTPQTGLSSYAASSELPQSKSASKSEYVSGYEATGNKRQSSKQEETQPETEAITVFATKIRLPHSDEAKDWTEESSDDRVITLGGPPSDPEWRSACWSPSGANRLGGCFLAALTANLEVLIFAPSKEPLTGEWVQTASLTRSLLEATDFPQSTPQTARELDSWEGKDQWHARRVMDCQTLCMSWSPRINGGELSGRSILALGHKAGTITFWSVDKDFGMTLLFKIKASDRWISSLTFQDWSHTSNTKASIRLAYTLPTGLVAVAQLSLDAFEPALSLDRTVIIHEADERPLTGLEWSQSDRELLVLTQPGKVTLWSPSVEAGRRGWEGERTILLAKLGGWPGASKLSTCSGINAFTPTSIVLTLADGSFHLIDSLDFPKPNYNLAVSKYMSIAARQLFEETEASRLKRDDMSQVVMRCSGAIYLGQGVWAWNHQPTTPHDISYLIPSALFSTILTCHIPTHSQPQRATHLKDFQQALNGITTTFETSSTALIAPHLMPFSCRSAAAASSFDLLSPHLLRTIRQSASAGDGEVQPSAPSQCPDNLTDVKVWLAKGLRQALWETGSLAKLRVRYALASYLSTVDGPQKDEFSAQSESLSRLIIAQSLGVILEWAGRAKEFVKGPTDLRYLEHLIHALLSIYLAPSTTSPATFDMTTISASAGAAFDLALWFDPPLNIAVDPEALEELIQNGNVPPEQDEAHDIPEWAQGRNGLSTWLGEGGGEVVQLCPGCEEEVRFGDLELGVCKEGHVFDRCSISLSVISAPQHRKCLTCARPALLPASFPLPHIKKGRGNKTKMEQVTDQEVPPAAEGADGDVVMQEADGDGGGPAANEAAENEDWLLEVVLDSGGACIYCGGRFALAM